MWCGVCGWLRQQKYKSKLNKTHKIMEGLLYRKWSCEAKVLGSGPIDQGSIPWSVSFSSPYTNLPFLPAFAALMAYYATHYPAAVTLGVV